VNRRPTRSKTAIAGAPPLRGSVGSQGSASQQREQEPALEPASFTPSRSPEARHGGSLHRGWAMGTSGAEDALSSPPHHEKVGEHGTRRGNEVPRPVRLQQQPRPREDGTGNGGSDKIEAGSRPLWLGWHVRSLHRGHA
jgi:hypothetical protein